MVPRPQPLGRSQTTAGQPGSTARRPRQAPPGPGAGWSGQRPGVSGGVGARSWLQGKSHDEPDSRLPSQGPRGVLKAEDRLDAGGGSPEVTAALGVFLEERP